MQAVQWQSKQTRTSFPSSNVVYVKIWPCDWTVISVRLKLVTFNFDIYSTNYKTIIKYCLWMTSMLLRVLLHLWKSHHCIYWIHIKDQYWLCIYNSLITSIMLEILAMHLLLSDNTHYVRDIGYVSTILW